MIKRQRINADIMFAGILFFILWIYLILRVIYVPFHEDEIATWFIYIMHSQLTPICDYVDANNHVLNTNLSWLFAQIFNSSPEILRIPNLLFFPVYFIYSFKITRLIQERYIRFTIFLGLVMAHHLFDFFGLCRGYGISMGLLLASCFYLMRYLSNHKFSNLSATLILSFFMVWANLSLLGTAYIFFALLVINVFTSNKGIYQKIWLLLFLFISFAIVLGYSTWYAIYLQKTGKLYLGIKEGGSIMITILTLLNILFRTKSIYLFLLTAIFFVLIVAGAFFGTYKNGIKNYLRDPLNLFSVLLFGNILLIYTEHWLLGVVYPTERATLYFYPMFIIAIGFAIDNLKQLSKRKIIPYLVTPVLFVPVHFLLSLNLDYTSAYRWESYPERYIRYIHQNTQQCDIYPIVGIYDSDRWIYDNFRSNGNIPFIDETNYPDTIADFQIGKYGDNPYLKTLYDSLDYDSRNGFILMKRKVFLKRIPVLRFDSITTNGITDKEYVSFTPAGQNDTISGTHFLYYFDLVVSSPQHAFEGFIISSIRNTQIYEPLFLERISEHWDKRRLKVGVLIRDTETTTKIPFAYFWNKKKVPFSIEEGSLTIYKIE